MKRRYHSYSLILAFCVLAYSELGAQTVGNLFIKSNATEGYSLFSPTAFNKTYLVDNCGFVYNEWEHDFKPGLKSFLGKNGSLYIAQKDEDPKFNIAGGAGGIIEKFDWNGNKEWQLLLSNDTILQHHDFIEIPNGNFLFLLSHRIEMENAIALGRDTSLINENGLLSEIIIELEINDSGSFDVIWEWKAIDHIIQNYDSQLPNYGSPSDFPERIDFNLGEFSRNTADWLHFNSIDYSEEHDQILISSRSLSEVFIIDKSASTLEAATHSGGNSAKGGDLLFRWGNPSNYTLDTLDPQNLYGQHDAKFINEGSSILLYNNGTGRGDTISFSSADEINLRRQNFNFDFLGKEAIQEEDVVWTYYDKQEPETFYSKIMSGVIRLKNGNSLITEATKGRIIEVDFDGNILRTYIVPVNFSGPINQFDIPVANTIFKARFYTKDFFDDNAIILANSGTKIELNPIDNCDPLSAKDELVEQSSLTILAHGFKIELVSQDLTHLQLIDINGSVLFSKYFDKEIVVPSSHLSQGMYFLSLQNSKMGLSTYKVLHF